MQIPDQETIVRVVARALRDGVEPTRLAQDVLVVQELVYPPQGTPADKRHQGLAQYQKALGRVCRIYRDAVASPQTRLLLQMERSLHMERKKLRPNVASMMAAIREIGKELDAPALREGRDYARVREIFWYEAGKVQEIHIGDHLEARQLYEQAAKEAALHHSRDRGMQINAFMAAKCAVLRDRLLRRVDHESTLLAGFRLRSTFLERRLKSSRSWYWKANAIATRILTEWVATGDPDKRAQMDTLMHVIRSHNLGGFDEVVHFLDVLEAIRMQRYEDALARARAVNSDGTLEWVLGAYHAGVTAAQALGDSESAYALQQALLNTGERRSAKHHFFCQLMRREAVYPEPRF